ncbi:MAG: SGNH/GDSL hydrolase family protein [Candidatus Binatia bacterium]
MSAPPTARRWGPALARIALGLAAGLVLVELAVRVATGTLASRGGVDGGEYGVTDPLVGRVPKPGISVRVPKGGFTISTGAHGTRNNGNPPPATSEPPILVVGDSFAFGDEVDDAQSWPAHLERALDRRVINAAVPGFGLDQAVLRAEQLAPIYRPAVIVVGVIPHDVLRCGMSYWSGNPKPYFTLDAAGLQYQPAPIPAPRRFAALRALLAHSVALELVFARQLHWPGPYIQQAHTQGRAVACALIARLADFGRAHDIRVVVVIHPQEPESSPEQRNVAVALAACAEANRLTVVDLFPAFDAETSVARATLFDGHLTADGNRLVATALARALPRAAE